MDCNLALLNPDMSQPPQQSFRPRGGRGGGFRGGFRGGAGGRGRGRGGFHHHNKPRQPVYHPDVDYAPEAIEQRFAAYYLPSMTQDPWKHLAAKEL
ncbi:hypothetical protein PS15m_008897 [Mucor circinelloides]